MKKFVLYAKVALVFAAVVLVGLCISWVGDIFRAAAGLPWYKIAGVEILLFALLLYVIISLYAMFGRRR